MHHVSAALLAQTFLKTLDKWIKKPKKSCLIIGIDVQRFHANEDACKLRYVFIDVLLGSVSQFFSKVSFEARIFGP